MEQEPGGGVPGSVLIKYLNLTGEINYDIFSEAI
jgi:hypothetical protein